ncbi:MAG TPA: LysM peptidoglycan-binding domain-containing protein [Chthoniobacteraceae bacterium]|nr:LysM peptidoglycan-binding domain-containing protein [Chthoniobacteraceae bacterium]
MLRKIVIFLLLVPIVVVVLNVIAVVGICVFSGLKARRISMQQQQQAAQAHADSSENHSPAAGDTAPKIVANVSASSVKDSGELYTVAKGDTPVSIAKKLRVNYDDLMKLNKITDPAKLQVGRRLRVPEQRTAGETNVAEN